MSAPSLHAQIQAGTLDPAALLPPEIEEESKPRDWIKITALVILVLSGLVTAFALMAYMEIFPMEILGGLEPTLFTLFATGLIAASSGAVFYVRWKSGD